MKARNRIFMLLGILLVIALCWYFFSTERSGDLQLIGTVDANEVVISSRIPGRIQTLGQAVTMTAMGRGDDVRGTQGPAGSDGRRLLPGGEMDEAGDLAVAVERRHALLEAANHEHAALHLGQIDHGIPGEGGGTVGHQTCTVLVGTT